jgi:hypothetical protein
MVANTATGRTTRESTGSRLGKGAKISYFPELSTPSYPMHIGEFSPGIERPELEVDRSFAVTGVAIFELYLDVSIRVRGMDFHIAQ